MQESPSRLEPGDLVEARGEIWRVDRTSAFDGCVLTSLEGVASSNRGGRRVLIQPFDRLSRVERIGRPLAVRRRRWIAAFRSLIAREASHGCLAAAAGARFDLLPYQLEPALSVVRGMTTRLLLADEVGLGKTVQAGLVLAELHARAETTRSLILTPAGLRDQWAGELRTRFSLDATIVDAAFIRRAAAVLPAGTNPWGVSSIVLTSIDLVKRAEVLRAVEPFVWDLLIVDEAHAVASDSDRGRAVRALAARARRMVLLTATPHAGQPEDFAALCDVGRIAPTEAPILLFRRSRRDVGLAIRRRVHLLRVRARPAEDHMHALLDDYTTRLWREAGDDPSGARRLVATVLQKRALSSAAALARTVRRRLEALSVTAFQPRMAIQMGLPLDDPDGETDREDAEPVAAVAAPGLADPADERRRLLAILEAAGRSATDERKFGALARVLRRAGEPAIVFTEYRDTAALAAAFLAARTSCVLLHGGLTGDERREVERAFTSGSVRVLVATDVGSEGLNLQARCRLVVNLELPWNPLRLEQRIGRVERIGQARTVHAFHLVAAGTAEEIVLARLAARVEVVRRSIGGMTDTLGLPAEREIEAAVLSRMPLPDGLWTCRPSIERSRTDTAARLTPCTSALSDLAVREAQRLLARRRLAAWHRDRTAGARRPLLTTMDLRRLKPTDQRRAGDPKGAAWPGRAVVCLFRVRILDGRGHLIEDALVPCATFASIGEVRTPAAVRSAIERVRAIDLAAAAARRWAAGRLLEVEAVHQPIVQLARERDTAIAARIERDLGCLARPVQAGLFDRRAIRAIERETAVRAALHGELARSRVVQMQHLELASAPELVLVLVVT